MSILSRLACEWAVRAFGRDHVANAPVRALRILEEAVELCQAFKVPPEKVAACVEIVYSRPPGDPVQELGGAEIDEQLRKEFEGQEFEPASACDSSRRRYYSRRKGEVT